MTTEQQREACAELARRMGWTAQLITCGAGKCWTLFTPTGKETGDHFDREKDAWREEAPDYFTDPVASRELVAWLAADDARWAKLKQQLTALWGSAAEQDLIRFALTLPCKTIAEAACKALGIEVSE